MGCRDPREDEYVRKDDEAILMTLPVLFRAGVEEGDVLRAVRILGDSARRVAQFQARYFHNTIEEPFRRRGLGDNEAFEAALNEVGLRMGHTTEDMLGWLFRRHAEIFSTEHHFEHVETALEEAGVRQRSPRGIEAAAFADLSGYTRLTEEAGDDEAARPSRIFRTFGRSRRAWKLADRLTSAGIVSSLTHRETTVRAFALVELGDSEAIDLFLPEEDARRALAEALLDEPQVGRALVRGVGELGESEVSIN